MSRALPTPDDLTATTGAAALDRLLAACSASRPTTRTAATAATIRRSSRSTRPTVCSSTRPRAPWPPRDRVTWSWSTTASGH
ncbi:hypothetical protein NKG05_20180 [Oerskovia sp. M15]